MRNRGILKNYIRNGGDRFLCSPQIGAGAGFDARLSGKTWLSDVGIEDTIAVCRRFDMIPLYNFGLPDLTRFADGVSVTGSMEESHSGKRRTHRAVFHTPKGDLHSCTIAEELKGSCPVEYYVKDEDDLDIFEYYLDALLEVRDFSAVTEEIRRMRAFLGEGEAMDIQWAMQPYELLCFPSTMDTAILFALCEDRCRQLMDKILRLDEKLIRATADGGSDQSVLDAVTGFVSAPTSAVILLTIGYDLVLKEIRWKETSRYIIMRLVTVAILIVIILAVNRVFLNGMIHEGAAILLMILPPPYVLPIFADDPSQRTAISSALSALTLVSLILFAVMTVLV